MSVVRYAWVSLFWFALVACGPETIFVRPGLDTPSQHVYNGQTFLKRGKIADAHREFTRAKELDPECVEAYVGLGLIMGHLGDFKSGFTILDEAQSMSKSDAERKKVQNGYEKLQKLQETKRDEAKTPPNP